MKIFEPAQQPQIIKITTVERSVPDILYGTQRKDDPSVLLLLTQ